LAIAGVLQAQALSNDRTAGWVGARQTAETLKAHLYRCLTQVPPYTSLDNAQALRQLLSGVRDQQATLLAAYPAASNPSRQLPRINDFTTYVSGRAHQQADWHRTRSAQYSQQGRRLRGLQIVVTAVGAVLTAVAAAQPSLPLSSWTAAATTVAAALGAYLAARQFRRLAVTFADTALQLDDVIATAGAAAQSPQAQARFVDQTEAILAAQTGTWPQLMASQQ
jgi:hypothetical protein